MLRQRSLKFEFGNLLVSSTFSYLVVESAACEVKLALGGDEDGGVAGRGDLLGCFGKTDGLGWDQGILCDSKGELT
jgi:hypothetical protein